MCRLDMKPASISRSFKLSNGNMNFLSLSCKKEMHFWVALHRNMYVKKAKGELRPFFASHPRTSRCQYMCVHLHFVVVALHTLTSTFLLNMKFEHRLPKS